MTWKAEWGPRAVRAAIVMIVIGLFAGASHAGDGVLGGAATQTTTTTYTYNADGALTSVASQVDGEPATTTYVTHDNFTPSASDPTTGTVSAANGNLLGYGPSPGAAALEAEFAFDVRDRLIGYGSAAGESAVYAYHPSSLLSSSTLPSGDALFFYYDASPHPQVTNVVQSSSGITSSFLAGREARYLVDGSEQLLLTPRKDVAGIYDAAGGSFTPYAFDPYGAPLAAASGDGSSPGPDYDMAENPFQYTKEYRDPLWGGYYLRARWYDPTLQVFLSRDPLPNLNRYGYTGGNPVMRVDPTGMGYQHTMQPLNNFLNKDLGGDGHGPWGEVWGGVARMVLAPVIGPLQLVATPETFWRTLTHSKRQAILLWGGIATEVATAPFPGVSFGAHLAIDAGFGLAQSTLSAFSHNFHQFRVAAFVHGLELTAGGMFYGRYLGGAGYRPFNLNAEDVDRMALESFDLQNSHDPLVFRFKIPLKGIFNITSPFMEYANLGLYHEGLMAVTEDEVILGEVLHKGFRTFVEDREESLESVDDFGGKYFRAAVTNGKAMFEYVGSFDLSLTGGDVDWFKGDFLSNPNSIPTIEEYQAYKTNRVPFSPDRNPYRLFSNNCHIHTEAILRATMR